MTGSIAPAPAGPTGWRRISPAKDIASVFFQGSAPRKTSHATTPPRERIAPAVERLAADVASRGTTLTHVALRWVLEQPGVTAAIVGASRAEQLRDSLGALNVELDDADRRACDEAWYALPRRRPEEER